MNQHVLDLNLFPILTSPFPLMLRYIAVDPNVSRPTHQLIVPSNSIHGLYSAYQLTWVLGDFGS